MKKYFLLCSLLFVASVIFLSCEREDPEPEVETRVPVTGVTLSPMGPHHLQFNENKTFVATVIPNNATNQSVTWRSSNPEVATIDTNGRVTPVSEGHTWISVTVIEEGIRSATTSVMVGSNFVDRALILKLINEQRTTGCNCGYRGYFPATTPVVWNDLLEKAAQAHSNDMAARRAASHTGSDGSTVGDRLKRVGYDFRTWGECVASGQRTTQEVVRAWMNSPGHCAIIMSPNLEEIGLGRTTNFWTLKLAAPR